MFDWMLGLYSIYIRLFMNFKLIDHICSLMS